MRRLICKDICCKHHGDNDVCTKPTVQIDNATCVSFEKGFYYYIQLVYSALSNSNFISADQLSEDMRIGLFYVMEISNLCFSMSTRGAWQFCSLHTKEGGNGVTTKEILELPINEEKLMLWLTNFQNGILPIQESKAEPPKKTAQSFGWLSPTGDFMEGDFGEHEQIAWDIMRQKKWTDEFHDSDEYTARDFLSSVKGYCLIHNPSGGFGYIVSHEKPLTKKQKEFLYGYFIDMGDKFRAEAYLDS